MASAPQGMRHLYVEARFNVAFPGWVVGSALSFFLRDRRRSLTPTTWVKRHRCIGIQAADTTGKTRAAMDAGVSQCGPACGPHQGVSPLFVLPERSVRTWAEWHEKRAHIRSESVAGLSVTRVRRRRTRPTREAITRWCLATYLFSRYGCRQSRASRVRCVQTHAHRGVSAPAGTPRRRRPMGSKG